MPETPIPEILALQPGDDRDALMRLMGIAPEDGEVIAKMHDWHGHRLDRMGAVLMVNIEPDGRLKFQFGLAGIPCVHEAARLMALATINAPPCEKDEV